MTLNSPPIGAALKKKAKKERSVAWLREKTGLNKDQIARFFKGTFTLDELISVCNALEIKGVEMQVALCLTTLEADILKEVEK